MTMTMAVEMPDSFSLELRSLLTGLLQRDVNRRLGCRGRGADEIKSHPFFRGIDWRVVYLQRLSPPLIPARGEVNAADAFDIGSFDDEDTKHIKLTDADQELYRNFPVVVSERWQHEIAETIFDYINHEADKAQMKRKNKHKLGFQGEEEESDCILHGYIKRLGGTFTATWLTRYVRLYPNRLELWSDSGKQPELIFMDQIEEVCNDYVLIKSDPCIVIKLYTHSKYVFSNSDEIGLREWHVSLKAAHADSVNLISRMAEKATKIYGTEVPLKLVAQRRKALEKGEPTNSGGFSISINAATRIANLEQKIIQRALANSTIVPAPSSTVPLTPGMPPVSGPTESASAPPAGSRGGPLAAPASAGEPTPGGSIAPAASQRSPSAAALAANKSGPTGEHKHHRGHHQHRGHNHRHYHHGQQVSGVTGATTGSARHHHHHHHHHHQGQHVRHSMKAARSRGQVITATVESAPESRRQASDAEKPAAREAETAEQAPGNVSLSPERQAAAALQAGIEALGKSVAEVCKVVADAANASAAIVAADAVAEEASKPEVEGKNSSSNSMDDESASSSSTCSSSDGASSGKTAINQGADQKPTDAARETSGDRDHDDTGPAANASRQDEGQVAKIAPTTTADEISGKPSIRANDNDAPIKLAVSLENVSEQQEVLRDPSKRITSDNKQREQDLVAQYEKLNVTARTSSESIEENE